MQKSLHIWLLLLFGCINSHAGVTMITHGLQLFNNYPDWVDAMGEAIYQRAGSNSMMIHMEVGKTGPTLGNLNVVKYRMLKGKTSNEPDWNGQVIVKLFWHTVAGPTDPYSTTDIARAAYPFLVAPIQVNEQTYRPLASLPFHFIGHSRGGSLICELSRMLGHAGIWVHHLTTLDPRPTSIFDLTLAIDAPLFVGENVLFLDNYFQKDDYPSGEAIPGSAQIYLSRRGTFGHSDVHKWYLGTITTLSFPIPPYWYSTQDIGFSFSSIAGGTRLRNYLSPVYAEPGSKWNGAQRKPISPPDKRLWSNIEIIQPIEPFFLVGQTVQLSSRVMPAEGYLAVGVDDDRNPFNNSTNVLRTVTIFTNTTVWTMTNTTSFVVNETNMTGNLFAVVGNFSPNTWPRFYYLDNEVQTERLRFTGAKKAGNEIVWSVNANGVTPLLVQSSDDLSEWTDVGTTVNETFTIRYPDPSPPYQFLRAVVK
jgi:hypothetical protein